MHKSAMLRMKWFVDNYIPKDKAGKVLDVGSYDVNGSFKELFKDHIIEYVGLDMASGPNVDFIPDDPYNWVGLSDESFDFVISGNAFEHIEYPWLTIREIYRKLKEGGFACIIAPNSIDEHRYPVDCYRYYSDGFKALAKWGGFQVVNVSVSGVPDDNVSSEWYSEGYNDTMMIITKNCSSCSFEQLPGLTIEKRYKTASEWETRFRFLLKWVRTNDKKGRIRDFISEAGISKIYIYGYGDIGRIIFDELRRISDIDVSVIDKKGGIIGDKTIIKPDEPIENNTETCMINAVLDNGMLEHLKEIYPNLRIISPFELL